MYPLDALILQRGNGDSRHPDPDGPQKHVERDAVQTADGHIGHAVDLRVVVELPCPDAGILPLEGVILLLLDLEHGYLVLGVVLLHTFKNVLAHGCTSLAQPMKFSRQQVPSGCFSQNSRAGQTSQPPA